jgi:3',5'-cyclic AMP phosphodiesterase CpdA
MNGDDHSDETSGANATIAFVDKQPFLSIALSASYFVVFFFHLYLGLPILKRGFWLVGYICVGLVCLPPRLPWKSVALLIAYFSLPFVGTLLYGYTVFARLHMSGPPVLELEQSVSSVRAGPLIIHISDTHILGLEESNRTNEGEIRNPKLIEGLTEQIISLKPHFLLITGDITDKGKTSEWTRARSVLLDAAHRRGIVVILAPGNHDLQPAFYGVSRSETTGNGELDRSTLVRRFLEAEVAMNASLKSAREPLQKLVSWQPTDQSVEQESAEEYRTCILNPPAGGDMSWDIGCALATQKDRVRQVMIDDYAVKACPDWFPLSYYDDENLIVVLCSVGQPTMSIGANALGSFGNDQVGRVEKLLANMPATTKRVLILLHHPGTRRWDDSDLWPERWWKLRQWEDSPIWNYALMSTQVNDSERLIGGLFKTAQRHPQVSVSMFYGHRHQRYLSEITNGKNSILLSEAPAFGDEHSIGFRACYERSDSTELNCVWVHL